MKASLKLVTWSVTGLQMQLVVSFSCLQCNLLKQRCSFTSLFAETEFFYSLQSHKLPQSHFKHFESIASIRCPHTTSWSSLQCNCLLSSTWLCYTPSMKNMHKSHLVISCLQGSRYFTYVYLKRLPDNLLTISTQTTFPLQFPSSPDPAWADCPSMKPTACELLRFLATSDCEKVA